MDRGHRPVAYPSMRQPLSKRSIVQVSELTHVDASFHPDVKPTDPVIVPEPRGRCRKRVGRAHGNSDANPFCSCVNFCPQPNSDAHCRCGHPAWNHLLARPGPRHRSAKDLLNEIDDRLRGLERHGNPQLFARGLQQLDSALLACRSERKADGKAAWAIFESLEYSLRALSDRQDDQVESILDSTSNHNITQIRMWERLELIQNAVRRLGESREDWEASPTDGTVVRSSSGGRSRVSKIDSQPISPAYSPKAYLEGKDEEDDEEYAEDEVDDLMQEHFPPTPEHRTYDQPTFADSAAIKSWVGSVPTPTQSERRSPPVISDIEFISLNTIGDLNIHDVSPRRAPRKHHGFTRTTEIEGMDLDSSTIDGPSVDSRFSSTSEGASYSDPEAGRPWAEHLIHPSILQMKVSYAQYLVYGFMSDRQRHRPPLQMGAGSRYSSPARTQIGNASPNFVDPSAPNKRKRDESTHRHSADCLSHQTMQQPEARSVPDSVGFACPYAKLKPNTYWKCYQCSLKSISDVEQHLYHSHAQPDYCPLCYATFKSNAELGQHLRARVCEEVPPREVDGLTKEQVLALNQSQGRGGPEASAEARWTEIWSILFPQQPRPQSVFIDNYVARERAAFLEYVRSEGPKIAVRMIQKLPGKLSLHEPEIQGLIEATLPLALGLLMGMSNTGHKHADTNVSTRSPAPPAIGTGVSTPVTVARAEYSTASPSTPLRTNQNTPDIIFTYPFELAAAGFSDGRVTGRTISHLPPHVKRSS